METTHAAQPGPSAASTGSPSEAPLKVKIKDGQLVVSIGINTLAWAAQPENEGPLEGWRITAGRESEWADDVAREMMRDDGGWGSQPKVGEWIDTMMVAASQRGSGAQEEVNT